MFKQLINMKNCNLKNIFSFVILFVSINSFAQQDALFTQYMYNMSVINPGYATNDVGTINVGGIYRTQWVGVTGAPDSGSFFAHSALTDKVEVGLSFVNDKIGEGVWNSNRISGDFAYVLPVSDRNKLSFGIKAGVSLFNSNASSLRGGNLIANESYALPNIGVGAFYFGDKYYIGLSSPNLLKTNKSTVVSNIKTSTELQSIHYYLTGGYVFDLSSSLKYKPSFMLRAEPSVPMSFDITNSFLINEKVELGISYRLKSDITGNVLFSVSPKLRIGYAYDYAAFNKLNTFSSGSHEIMVLFDLGGVGNSISYDKSPRFY